MPADADSLPDDIEALKALLRQRDGELQQLRDTVSTLEQALSVRALETEQLHLQLAKLKRMQFDRKSEKLDRQIEQLETRLEDLLVEEGTQPAPEITPTPKAPVSKPATPRQPLPAHLPREERILEPVEQACPSSGGQLKPLGEEVSEQLDLIHAAFKVIRHIRRKKACACCDVIVQPPAPSRPIEPINYLLNHWQALAYYCEDGRVEIDNNIAENALRGVSLGRKNFLFLGSDSGGERATVMYSLIGSARLNGLDPQAYLQYVLTHIADQPVNRVGELLPWNVADKLACVSA